MVASPRAGVSQRYSSMSRAHYKMSCADFELRPPRSGMCRDRQKTKRSTKVFLTVRAPTKRPLRAGRLAASRDDDKRTQVRASAYRPKDRRAWPELGNILVSLITRTCLSSASLTLRRPQPGNAILGCVTLACWAFRLANPAGDRQGDKSNKTSATPEGASGSRGSFLLTQAQLALRSAEPILLASRAC